MILGIDVAKKKFDAALLATSGKIKSKVFANSKEGFAALLEWLAKQGAPKVHACMEATGVYGEELALALCGAGHKVSVVNPARIKGYGQSELSRTKTDKADAALIARFCRAVGPEEWTAPPPHLRRLRELARRLEALGSALQRERNRLGVSSEAEVRESIESVIAHMRKEIAKIKSAIRGHIDGHPDLRGQRDLLNSIPGIGEATITVVLAEFGRIESFENARKMSAFAGISPRHRQSGTSVRGKSRMSKTGSPRLRKALYMPSMVAIKHNPIIAEFSVRLKKSGKVPMVIIGAVMRKLVHIIFGVLRSGKKFDPLHEINKNTKIAC